MIALHYGTIHTKSDRAPHAQFRNGKEPDNARIKRIQAVDFVSDIFDQVSSYEERSD